ncbi:MAG TPA: hypothetical protein VK716_03785 [Terracidiphilus sp.]|jgi:hypothetical protein|nr:hypothetical protein [Terracidiphilus sp.]
MKKLLHVVPFLLVCVGFVLLFELPAYAYADPGTGLLAIQTLGSALVATGWYLRRRIRAIFSRTESSEEKLDHNPGGDARSDTHIP